MLGMSLLGNHRSASLRKNNKIIFEVSYYARDLRATIPNS